MPKKNIIASTSTAAAARPLPARFLEILVALPVFAWVENPRGKILAHNLGFAGCDQKSCRLPFAFRAARATRTTAAPSPASWKTTAYPLPPIEGCPQRLRLVTLVPDAHENDCHARVISALLALLLDTPRPRSLRLTPQQRDIYRELSRGSSNKEIAYTLGLSHNALHVQLSRMRKRLGEGIIPRRRSASASKLC